jgi:ribosomal protein L29
MAETKAKKPAAKKAVKETKSLAEQLVDAQNDMIEAKRSHKAGELVNPKVLGGYRKQIARIKTQIKQEATKEKEGK